MIQPGKSDISVELSSETTPSGYQANYAGARLPEPKNHSYAPFTSSRRHPARPPPPEDDTRAGDSSDISATPRVKSRPPGSHSDDFSPANNLVTAPSPIFEDLTRRLCMLPELLKSDQPPEPVLTRQRLNFESLDEEDEEQQRIEEEERSSGRRCVPLISRFTETDEEESTVTSNSSSFVAKPAALSTESGQDILQSHATLVPTRRLSSISSPSGLSSSVSGRSTNRVSLSASPVAHASPLVARPSEVTPLRSVSVNLPSSRREAILPLTSCKEGSPVFNASRFPSRLDSVSEVAILEDKVGPVTRQPEGVRLSGYLVSEESTVSDAEVVPSPSSWRTRSHASQAPQESPRSESVQEDFLACMFRQDLEKENEESIAQALTSGCGREWAVGRGQRLIRLLGRDALRSVEQVQRTQEVGFSNLRHEFNRLKHIESTRPRLVGVWTEAFRKWDSLVATVFPESGDGTESRQCLLNAEDALEFIGVLPSTYAIIAVQHDLYPELTQSISPEIRKLLSVPYIEEKAYTLAVCLSNQEVVNVAHSTIGKIEQALFEIEQSSYLTQLFDSVRTWINGCGVASSGPRPASTQTRVSVWNIIKLCLHAEEFARFVEAFLLTGPLKAEQRPPKFQKLDQARVLMSSEIEGLIFNSQLSLGMSVAGLTVKCQCIRMIREMAGSQRRQTPGSWLPSFQTKDFNLNKQSLQMRRLFEDLEIDIRRMRRWLNRVLCRRFGLLEASESSVCPTAPLSMVIEATCLLIERVERKILGNAVDEWPEYRREQPTIQQAHSGRWESQIGEFRATRLEPSRACLPTWQEFFTFCGASGDHPPAFTVPPDPSVPTSVRRHETPRIFLLP